MDSQPESALAPAQVAARTALVERLFQEHNDSLLRFLSMRLRSHQEAKEVAQEAYVRLLMLDEPGAVSYLRAFLFKTASNLAIDRMRSRRSQQRHDSFEFFAPRGNALSAERIVSGVEEVSLLQRLVSELPVKYQRALILNRFHGMDTQAIARDLHTTERSVRRYIMHALLHCRAGLDAAHGKAVEKGSSHEER